MEIILNKLQEYAFENNMKCISKHFIDKINNNVINKNNIFNISLRIIETDEIFKVKSIPKSFINIIINKYYYLFNTSQIITSDTDKTIGILNRFNCFNLYLIPI